ncbi:MAG: hypothetical protein Q8Q50_07125 [Methylobacter sp.]|jgi:hypothetical protein|nr:hypothetical protein [Methylobacter sp.]
MLDIQPVSPYSPVVKPKKINRDDERPDNQQRKKKQQKQKPDAESLHHIDEIV